MSEGREPLAAADVALADPRVLEALVCPVSKGPLHLSPARRELVSRAARLAFPIEQGVPILAREAARELEPDDPLLRR